MFVEHKEAVEITAAPAKTLKFSEAMRIGAAKRQQQHGWLFFEGKSCALGAALEGLGHEPYEHPRGASDPKYAAFYNHLDSILGRDLRVEVSGRNDRGDTREQIADWLEKKGF